jgi:molybdenum cofactor cytidylyltransferase
MPSPTERSTRLRAEVADGRITALILAAGESTRMGRLKQLLTWDGMPLIAWQVQQMRDAGVDDVVVVLGHAAEEIRRAVPAEARVVVNEAYEEGRATSLRCGAEAVEQPVGAILILSVDQPRPTWLTRLLIERWRETNAPVVSPRFPGGFGHPILVDGSLLHELRTVDEATLGLRAVIDAHVSQAEAVEIPNAAVDVDLNTPGDFEAAVEAFGRGDWNPDVNRE